MPAIFLMSGTGFAPIKSIIEDALKRGIRRPMRIYWGGRGQEDFHMLDRIATSAQRAPWLSFVAVLLQTWDPRQGRTGCLHRVVLQGNTPMTNGEVDACGNPPLIVVAQKYFVAEGAPPDVFVASGQDTLLA